MSKKRDHRQMDLEWADEFLKMAELYKLKESEKGPEPQIFYIDDKEFDYLQSLDMNVFISPMKGLENTPLDFVRKHLGGVVVKPKREQPSLYDFNFDFDTHQTDKPTALSMAATRYNKRFKKRNVNYGTNNK